MREILQNGLIIVGEANKEWWGSGDFGGPGGGLGGGLGVPGDRFFIFISTSGLPLLLLPLLKRHPGPPKPPHKPSPYS